jgi:two-component system NarL family sensor kinase
VRLWSPACEACLGWRAEEVVGRSLSSLAVQADGLRLFLRGVREGGEERMLATALLGPAGGAIRVDLACAPLPEGKGDRLLVVALPREGGSGRLREGASAGVEERRRLAAEIHDHVLQELAGLALQLDLLLAQLPPSPPSGLGEELRRAGERARRAMARLRGLLLEQWAEAPEEQGLAAAVHSLLVRERAELPLRVSLEVRLQREPSPRTRRLAYLLLREALANVVRHAEAAALEVRVESVAGGLRLRVRDDGRGFDASRPPGSGHLGLAIMAERVHAAGGRLSLRSRPGAGTTVEAFLPDPPSEPEGRRF